jgi:hypothetical protein
MKANPNITLLLIFLIIVAILLLVGTCKNDPIVKEVIKKDTVYVPVRDTILNYIPQLVRTIDSRVDSFIQYEVIENPITHEKYNDLAAACNNLYWECTKTHIYSDTQHISYGTIIINDTVSRNKMRGRSLYTDLKIPVVTEYKTLPNKGKLFFGVGGNFTPIDTTMGLNASILWQTKKGYGLELGVGLNSRSAVTYGFKYLIPLKK